MAFLSRFFRMHVISGIQFKAISMLLIEFVVFRGHLFPLLIENYSGYKLSSMVWDLDLLNRENKLFSEVHFYIENEEDNFFRIQLKFY